MEIAAALDAAAKIDRSFTRRTVAKKELRVADDYFIAGREAYPLGRIGTTENPNLPLVSRLLRDANGSLLPQKYLDSLPHTLRDALLSHHLDEDFRHDEIAVVTDADRLWGFDRADLVALSVEQVVTAVIAGLGDSQCDVDVVQMALSNGKVTIDIVSKRTSVAVKVGDIVEGGVRIVHSLVGEKATELSPYMLRLACSNGAVSRTCLDGASRTRRMPVTNVNGHELQAEQIRNLSASSFAAVSQRLADVPRLLETTFASQREVEGHFRALLAPHRLSVRRHATGEDRTSILDRLIAAWETEGREMNGFGVWNALTRLATHDESLSTRQQYVLSRLAGLFAFREHRVCPRCQSLLRGDAAANPN